MNKFTAKDYRQDRPGASHRGYSQKLLGPKFSDNLGELLRKLLGENSDTNDHATVINRLEDELCRYTGLENQNILICAGVDSSIELILGTFFKAGKNIIMSGPIESAFMNKTESLGVETDIRYGENPFMVNIESLIEGINDNTSIVYTGNPTRPAGAVFSLVEIERILNYRHNAILILDESDFEITEIDSSSLINKYKNIIIMRKFPKLLGLAATSDEIILAHAELIDRMRNSDTVNDNLRISGTAAIAAIRSLDFTKRDRKTIKENMILMSTRLRSLGWHCQATSFDYLLIADENPDKLTASLIRAGVSCRNLSAFNGLERYISINIGSDILTERTLDAFQKLAEQNNDNVKEQISVYK